MATIDYGGILRKSRGVVFKFKWLWVYGLVVTAMEGVGFSSFDWPSGSQDKLKDLGAASNFLSDWLAQVPLTTWLLLVVGIIALVLVGIVVNLVIRNLAKGSLIAGIALADTDQPVTLVNTSPKGIAVLKPLMLFGALSLVIVVAVLTAVFGLGAVMFALNPILGGVYSVVAFLGVLVGFAVLATVGVYADRLIVFEGCSPWRAWKLGLGYGWRNFFSTVVMGLINTSIGCVGGCLTNLVLLIVLGLPALLLAWPLFRTPTQIPGPAAWVTLVILFILFLTANAFVRALLIVFNYSNWSQFYSQIVNSKHE